MKVYLVTRGAYSDYSVEAIFLDKDLAQKYIDNRTVGRKNFFGFNEIEEFDTYDEEHVQCKDVFYVKIDYSGAEVHRWLEYTEGEREDWAWQSTYACTIVGSSTRGYDVALKVARDKLAEYVAKKAGL